jgi:ankyrin repeat protein
MSKNKLNKSLAHNASSVRVEELLRLYPQAIKVQDKHGKLPLHTALRFNGSDDVINMLFQAYPKATEVRDSEGRLPLHKALFNEASSDVIKMLFNAYPKAVEVQNSGGWLPLHFALYYNASPDIINMVFKAYPKAVEIQDKYQRIRLRFACTSEFCLRESSLEMLNILISAYPGGIDTQDSDGIVPLDYLKAQAATLTSIEHLYLLHIAVFSAFSTHLVKFLLQAFPKSCMTKDIYGMVLLHHACASTVPHFMEVVMTLIDADEDSLKIKDKQGRTPMQVLKFTASHQDTRKMFPLHHLAASSESLTEKCLLLLFSSYPESIQTPDKYGMLPFHHA